MIKSLESIKNQTYENFEIIVVDDKSSDNSVKQNKEFAQQNSKLIIKLIEHTENKARWLQCKRAKVCSMDNL